MTFFPEELGALADLGAIEITAEAIALTPRGHRHRDVVVQPFFSDRVRGLVNDFDYNE